jgi:hypothetical protein
MKEHIIGNTNSAVNSEPQTYPISPQSEEWSEPIRKAIYEKHFSEDLANQSWLEIESLVKTEIRKAEEKKIAMAMEIIELYGTPNCDYLNHNKKTYHKGSEVCPVVLRINNLLEALKK